MPGISQLVTPYCTIYLSRLLTWTLPRHWKIMSVLTPFLPHSVKSQDALVSRSVLGAGSSRFHPRTDFIISSTLLPCDWDKPQFAVGICFSVWQHLYLWFCGDGSHRNDVPITFPFDSNSSLDCCDRKWNRRLQTGAEWPLHIFLGVSSMEFSRACFWLDICGIALLVLLQI